jgi:hypothetical protein
MAYYYMHPDLSLPDDASIIWRYMELGKFQSMIRENSIFFSRADKQSDELEGKYPEALSAALEREFGDGIPSDDGNTYTFLEWHTQKERRSRLVSCWSLGPSESQKMWDKYTQSGNSIAIRSTIARLKNCFHDQVEPVVWIGKVRYGEEDNSLLGSIYSGDVNFLLYPFFAKRDSYRWENEVRAIVNIALAKQAQFVHSPNGCYIKADLKILVDSVWLNPQSPAELRGEVGACLNEYGFGDVEIYQSVWDCLP